MPLIMKKTIDGQPVKIRLSDGTLYAGLPIGFILPSFEDETPLGFLKMTDTLANRTVSRTTYKELFDWATARGLIGTGKPFGVGDGSTTFVIPDGKEIAFKGIGEYEGTVGAHVKTGGLAVGEFIDDRLQEHRHNGSWVNQSGITISTDGSGYNFQDGTGGYVDTASANKGATTEVKSLGCHYYIKAKNVGVPADFVSAIDDVIGERLSYSTTEINTGKKWIDGKTIYRKCFTELTYGGTTGAWTNTGATLSNVDKLIKADGLMEQEPSTMQICFRINNSNVQYLTSIGWGSSKKALILEYTKTTD